jgi:IclR family transcriptional regulator, KDG regulon repressor
MSATANSSVDQVFDVLALVSASQEPIGLAQLARTLDVPTSTAHRVLATLEEAGYVTRDTTGTKYQLGLGAQELAHALLRRFPLQAASQPWLHRLAAATGETVVLCGRVGFYRVRLASAEGTSDVHAAPRLGQTARLGDTPGGRAILAFDDELRAAYLRWLGGGRANAATRALARALERIRRDGSIVETHDDGRANLAVPLCGPDGRAFASLVIEAAESSGGERTQRARLARLRSCAEELQALVAERPELAADPFAHIPPEELSPGFDPA